jgi:16S rRNA (uracil1498-N3)-methyltransferase
MDAHTIPSRTPRFYCPSHLSPGAVVDLPDQAAHHAMRAAAGTDDRVRLFNGDGGEWIGEIRSISRSGVSVRIVGHDAREVEARLKVTLARDQQPRAHGLHAQKAVELGVAEISPLETWRSV